MIMHGMLMGTECCHDGAQHRDFAGHYGAGFVLDGVWFVEE